MGRDRIETRVDGSHEYKVLVTAEGHESRLVVFDGDEVAARNWAVRWRRGGVLDLRNFYPFEGENMEAAAKMHARAGGTIAGALPAHDRMEQAVAMRETMTPGYGNTTAGAFAYHAQREARARFVRFFRQEERKIVRFAQEFGRSHFGSGGASFYCAATAGCTAHRFSNSFIAGVAGLMVANADKPARAYARGSDIVGNGRSWSEFWSYTPSEGWRRIEGAEALRLATDKVARLAWVAECGPVEQHK